MRNLQVGKAEQEAGKDSLSKNNSHTHATQSTCTFFPFGGIKLQQVAGLGLCRQNSNPKADKVHGGYEDRNRWIQFKLKLKKIILKKYKGTTSTSSSRRQLAIQ